jgi:phosphoribosylanthranilate isomerase
MIRVKICGLTVLEDALWAAQCGADLLGFVFYPPSPRRAAVERVREIIPAVRRAFPAMGTVGVFVDEPVDRVQHVVQTCGLDYAQMHGHEPPAVVAALDAQGIQVIKVLRIDDRAALPMVERYQAAAYLVDASLPGRPGGTGRTLDWSRVAGAGLPEPLLLAGGLTPNNVATAIRVVQPWGVDVAGGVERAPGRKDPDRVARFIAAAKGSTGEPI